MEKSTLLTIVLVVSLLVNGILAFELSQSSTDKAALAGDPKQIMNDLIKLKSDLAGQKACSTVLTKADFPEVEMRKRNLLRKIKADTTKQNHFGLICLSDIVNMLLEAKDGDFNNSIAIYPEWNTRVSGTHDSIGVFCIGTKTIEAPGAPNPTRTLEISSYANFYSPPWCPDMCPSNCVSGTALLPASEESK